MSNCQCIRGTGIDSADLYYTCKASCTTEKVEEQPSANTPEKPSRFAIEMNSVLESLERAAKRFGAAAYRR